MSKTKALHSKKSDKKDYNLIKGSCENCGKGYRFSHAHLGKKEPKCPGCGKETQNWDTVHGSTMAPSMVRITK